MRRISLLLLAGVGVAGLGVASCAGGSTAQGTTAPTPVTAANLTGTWSGSSSDTSGQGTMTWTITQNSNALAGTMGVSDTARGMMGSGTIRGTVDGRTVAVHMEVPTGGFTAMMSGCAMALDGQATISDDGHTMTGTYDGHMSGMMSQMETCGSQLGDGHFTLSR